jgi:hypothetical protein
LTGHAYMKANYGPRLDYPFNTVSALIPVL